MKDKPLAPYKSSRKIESLQAALKSHGICVWEMTPEISDSSVFTSTTSEISKTQITIISERTVAVDQAIRLLHTLRIDKNNAVADVLERLSKKNHKNILIASMFGVSCMPCMPSSMFSAISIEKITLASW